MIDGDDDFEIVRVEEAGDRLRAAAYGSGTDGASTPARVVGIAQAGEQLRQAACDLQQRGD